MNTTRRTLLQAALAACCAQLMAPALAAEYPDHPIKVVVPFSPGGNADLVGRVLGARMGQTLGQAIVIDNRAGAGGGLGAEAVAKSPPDGYTLLIGTNGPLTVNPVLQPKLRYDVFKDFAPIALTGVVPHALVVTNALPAKTLPEFLVLARSKPLSVATAGVGSSTHLTLERLNAQAGLKLQHIPYRGGNTPVGDLIGGTLDAVIMELSAAAAAAPVRQGASAGRGVDAAPESGARRAHLQRGWRQGFRGFELRRAARSGEDPARRDRTPAKGHRGGPEPPIGDRQADPAGLRSGHDGTADTRRLRQPAEDRVRARIADRQGGGHQARISALPLLGPDHTTLLMKAVPPPLDNPTAPTFRLPPLACDCHVHVYGPAHRFPYAPDRPYTPLDAPVERLEALHRLLGVERVVVVQATVHGLDNSAMLDAVARDPQRRRGVALLSPGTPAAELERLHRAGVRGVRFNFMRHLGGAPDLSAVLTLAKAIAPLGWHVQLHMDAHDLVAYRAFLDTLPVPFVIDHMGRTMVEDGADQPALAQLLDLLKDERAWVKLSGPERISACLSRGSFPYADVVPYAQRLIAAAPERVVWGTDWPHPNVREMPDDGSLVDLLPHYGDAQALNKLLVENPTRLYWYD